MRLSNKVELYHIIHRVTVAFLLSSFFHLRSYIYVYMGSMKKKCQKAQKAECLLIFSRAALSAATTA
jgi:hypothetical protein